MSQPCPTRDCGRPTHDGILCPRCGDDLRSRLHLIADRWPHMEEALTSTEAGGEKGRTKNGMVEVGTNINEAVVRARRACTDAVWFMVQVIRDDMDTADRPFTPPPVNSNRSQDETPALARWLAAWHIGHFTHGTDPESAAEVAGDIRRAEELTYVVCIKGHERKVPTGLPCEGHATSVDGGRVPCAGEMKATLGDSMPDLVCTIDTTHRIPPDVWSRNYWKRAHTMDEGAARNLLAQLGK